MALCCAENLSRLAKRLFIEYMHFKSSMPASQNDQNHFHSYLERLDSERKSLHIFKHTVAIQTIYQTTSRMVSNCYSLWSAVRRCESLWSSIYPHDNQRWKSLYICLLADLYMNLAENTCAHVTKMFIKMERGVVTITSKQWSVRRHSES